MHLLFGSNSSFGIFQTGKTEYFRQHKSVWPIKLCCPAHSLFALRRFRKTSKLPLYHFENIRLVGFLKTHMFQCKTFSDFNLFRDFCKSVQLLFMCVCVCAARLVRLFATKNILRLTVDLTTGGDGWNVIKIMFCSKNAGNENSENAKIKYY